MREAERSEVARHSMWSIRVATKIKDRPPPQPKKIFVIILALIGICVGAVAILGLLSPDQLFAVPVIGPDLVRLESGNTGMFVSLFGTAGAMLLLAGATGKREYVVAPLVFSAASLALEASTLILADTGFASGSTLWLPGLATAVMAGAWFALAPGADAHT